MPHDYSTRTMKEFAVSSECLQTLEANIINTINSLKDENISLEDRSLKDYKKKMKDFVTNANNWKTKWLLSNLLTMPLSNTLGGII